MVGYALAKYLAQNKADNIDEAFKVLKEQISQNGDLGYELFKASLQNPDTQRAIENTLQQKICDMLQSKKHEADRLSEQIHHLQSKIGNGESHDITT